MTDYNLLRLNLVNNGTNYLLSNQYSVIVIRVDRNILCPARLISTRPLRTFRNRSSMNHD